MLSFVLLTFPAMRNSDDLSPDLKLLSNATSEVAPTKFVNEMELTTDQRHDKLIKQFYRKKSYNKDCIDIVPPIIIFQKYKEGLTCTVPLRIINTGKTSCCTKLMFKYSPYFSVIHDDKLISPKLAPGMEINFIIQFLPEEIKDYWHQLKLFTENKEYTIPLIAIGPRPLLNLPDDIYLPDSSVKVGSEKHIIVKNTGQVCAVFNIHVKPPFYVLPLKGILESNETTQFTIKFKPNEEGNYSDTITFNYESGEKLVVTVQGSGQCSNIFLNKRKIQFENTYTGLQCQKNFEITNKSNHDTHFTWKKFDSSELDKMEGDKIKESFNIVREHESKKTTKLETYNVIDLETNEIIYDRIYKDEIAEFNRNEQFLFYHENFTIIPQVGTICANHSTHITVIFAPNRVQEFETTAYCEVTGRVERLPLKLRGVGIGSKFTLNLDSLDMNNVYLYTDHCFDVVVCNDGDIPGKISYVPRNYDFGINLSCNPNSLQLNPFEHGVFNMHFHCTSEGSFIEEIRYCVEQSEELLKVLINGKVLYPLLSVSVSEINFGNISLGYPVTKNVILFNKTPIEIPFQTNIHPDGSTTAKVLDSSYGSEGEEPIYDPKEYNVLPAVGSVPSNSSATLQITLVANVRRAWSTNLNVETWNTTKHRLSFELKHHGRIPELVCSPSEINIRFCFLNYLCHRLVAIKNKSNFAGFVNLHAEEHDGLKIETDVTEFCIEPYGIVEVSLNIVCTKLELQSTVLKLHVFGGKSIVICKISCTGQGPVISVMPENLSFGQVKLLEEICKTLTIYNDSPISAEVTLKVMENSPWRINLTKAYLEPEESRDVIVSVYLNNTIKYKGSIQIEVSHRGVIACKLTATGVGTSIKVTPMIAPVLDLGAQLTKRMINEELEFANKGTRNHKIVIAPSKNIKSTKQYNEGDFTTFFSWLPYSFSLDPDESIIVKLSGQSDKIQRIEENFYCHAVIGNMDKKQIIIETTVLANFVEPVLLFSKKEMLFRIDFDVDESLHVLTDIIEIKNTSPLMLQVDFTTQPPFYIELDDNYIVHHFEELKIDETYYMKVFFDSLAANRHCFVVKKYLEISYRGHTHKDFIDLIGEVNYPSVKFNPSTVNFGSVTANSQARVSVELKNVTPLPVRYHFKWLEEEIFMDNIPPVEKNKPTLESKDSLGESCVSSQPTEEYISKQENLQLTLDKNVKIPKKRDKGKIEKKALKTPEKKKSKEQKRTKNIPIEIICLQYCIETVYYPEEIQIFQELHEPVSTTNFIELLEQNRENLRQLKEILYPFVQSYSTDQLNPSILQCLNTVPPDVPDISKIIEIVPSYGFLEPYESQMLSLSYRPKNNTSVKAKVLCQVQGGPTEVLDITGSSSDTSYYLNKTSIDFGRQVFYEISQKNIKLINTGYVPFTFSTTAKESNEEQSAHLLEVGWFTVQPQGGTVFPQLEIELLVKYFPGIAGKFMESFQLEIGHLTPVTITVTGYGVFPQVHLNLPRPSMLTAPSVTCYTAIANITPDYLVFVENIKVWAHPQEEVHVADMSKEEKRKLQKDGWVVISYSNNYPSAMDIDLAIERMLAYEYITCHPEIQAEQSVSVGLKFLPRLHVPPYLIDFGYVISDTMVHYTVLILNYGSTSCMTCVVPNLKKSGFFQAGFNIQFDRGNILVGDTMPLYIIFCPTSEVYPTRRKVVKYTVTLEVERGLRIPVTVKAIVTIPFIETSVEHLEFNEVICGQRKMMNFFITNRGYVPCSWEVRLERISKSGKCQQSQDCTFYTTTFMGYLEVDEKILLDVYFEPNKGSQFEWKLTLNVFQNSEELFVMLTGVGVKPWLKIKDKYLEFEPSLPYSNDSVQYFIIANPCSFPIEYYLSDFDEQILQEDAIFKLLSEYYSRDRFYIPPRKPGQKLPDPLYKFYEDLLNELCHNVHLNEKDETLSQVATSTKAKKLKKRKVSSEISSLESIRTASAPLANKMPDEIESMLLELMVFNINRCTGSNKTDGPIEASFKQLVPVPLEKDPSEEKEGILIVFHGAPFTQSVYAANKTAKNLNLPVLNINELILEAVACNENISCTKVWEIINTAYNQLVDNDFHFLDNEDGTDPYKELARRIQILTSNDGKKRRKGGSAKSSARSSKSGKSKTSAASKQKKGNRPVDNSETLLGISQDLFMDVLKQKLCQYKLGIVIESLNNVFIRTPILTLMCLLTAVGNIKYIQCFLLYNSLQAYQAIIAGKQEAEKERIEQDTINMLEHFDCITEEEFENLSQEYLELYKNIYLAKRKENTEKRMETLRMRLAPKVEVKSKEISNKKRKKTEMSLKINIIPEKQKKSIDKSSKKSDKSNTSSKKSKKTVKLSPEMQKIAKEFENFNADYRRMLHILEYWDRKTCTLTKEYTDQATKKTDKPIKKTKKAAEKSSKPQSAVIANITEIETIIGIPFWIINNSNNESDMLNMISLVMHDYVEYQKARENLLKSLTLELKPSMEINSTICQRDVKRDRNVSNVFSITTVTGNEFSELNLPDQNAVTTASVPEIIESQTTANENDRKSITQHTSNIQPDDKRSTLTINVNTESSNKLRKSKLKKHSTSKPELPNSVETSTLTKRAVLQPGESIKYRVQFTPKSVGLYDHSYGIEMVGWNTKYTVNCKAECDTPNIDMNPRVLFSNIVREKNSQNEYQRNMFIKNTGIFDFGNTFLCNHSRKYEERLREHEATVYVKNKSLVPCEITTHLLQDTNVFKQQEENFTVKPDNIYNLVLTACPIVLGPNRNTLAISIKDNPKIELIPLNCTACKLEFEILNKKINFERVLLEHSEQRVVTFINYSIVPIYWEFTNIELFTDKFLINPQCGHIRENDCVDIHIDYFAAQVEVMPAKKLYLKIFEEYIESEPVLVEFIEISGETRDILIDCMENINFGEVKAKKNHTIKYDFMNRGKYNIVFEITELSTEELDKSALTILKMFKITDLNGVLMPAKVFTTNIIFNSQKTIDIKDYPIFKCNLMDHLNKSILSTFFITATAKTFYSHFKIYPTAEINFGAILVGTHSCQTLTITNTGRFPFDYTVACKQRMSAAQIKEKQVKIATKSDSKKSAKKSEGSGKSKKSKKSTESKKSAESKKSKETQKSGSKKSGKPSKTTIVSKKIKGMIDKLKKEPKLGPPITCGTFEIKNAKGTIQPQQQAELEIECNIIDVGSKEEKINIFVTESMPQDKDGKILTLFAIGCIPIIDFEDYSNIFKEHFVVNKEIDFLKPKELEHHCVFVTEDQSFVFNNVCINTTSSALVHLYNKSLVEAELIVKSTKPSIYTVNPGKLYIPSYTSASFTITFNPVALETYKATLELQLIMPIGHKTETKSIHLVGEGRVPEISLIKPDCADQNNNCTIIFEPTLVEKCSMKLISFQNTGDFPCKVIYEIYDDKDNVFTTHLKEDINKLFYDTDVPAPVHSDIIKLMPGETGNVNIIYLPTKVAVNKCKVKLHIVNNPFELFVIKITASSYSEDIVLEDIPTSMLNDNRKVSTVSLVGEVSSTSYMLDFGTISMNTLQKMKFKILNRSSCDIYKFMFKSAVREFKFMPAVGHLKPSEYKEMIVTFLTDIPVTYDKLIMECTICKIEYKEKVSDNIAWDDRQKLFVWNETNENYSEMLLDETGEPEYVVIDGNSKKIPVLLSITADYATYGCELSNIVFKDTMMFEKRVYSFSVHNVGNVNLEVNWNINLDNLTRPTSAIEQRVSRENSLTARPANVSSKQQFRKAGPLTGHERFLEQQCQTELSFGSTSTARSTNSSSCYMPFEIVPECIKIPPKGKYEMAIVFAPLDVYEYKAHLRGHVTNLSTDQNHINIGLVAKSLMPFCYFDVRLTDYITSGRRKVDKCGDFLDMDTKVVEFDCLGIGITHVKVFNIINPTEEDLNFCWNELKSSEISSVSLFTCNHPSDTITPGKMIEASFSILPQTTGTFEALYNFNIKKQNFITPFLFVANIREPNIYFLSTCLSLKPTIFGINVCGYVSLKNKENVDLNFKFRKSSLFSESRTECLIVEPRKGRVAKGSECKISITFNPTATIGEEIYALKCDVDFCKQPLVVHVKSICYEIQPIISYMLTSGNKISLNRDSDNIINLGNVRLAPHCTETVTFYIKNIGNTGFYYMWNLNDENPVKKFNVTVNNKEGYVKKDTEVNAALNIRTGGNSVLKNHEVDLKVKYGPRYKIFLNGSSTTAIYKFSFLAYDFGPCFIQNSNICFNHKTLEFANNGIYPITLENVFNNREYLSIDFQARQIMPKSKELIQICFHPCKCQKYHEDIVFLVNCQSVKLKLQGEGIEMNITLVSSDDKYINLGATKIDNLVSKTVKVLNRSPKAVVATFDIWDRLPIVTKPVNTVTHYLKMPIKERIIEDGIGEKSKLDEKSNKKTDKGGSKGNKTKSKKSGDSKKSDKSSKKSDKSSKLKERSKKSEKSSKNSKISTKEIELPEEIPEPQPIEDIERQLRANMITIAPKTSIIIPQNKTAEFVVNYLPTKRCSEFCEKISVQVLDTVKPLCIIKGRCVASDFRLDRDTISFGVAVLHCYRESKLTLINDGDVAARFSWNYESTREFSITPIVGYSCPGTCTVFNIMFCPTQIGVQSKFVMTCVIEDYEKQLSVNLIGMCCDLPSPLAYIDFRCPVRTEDKKVILIHNSSGQDWKLFPIISGDYFTGEEMMQVPAKSNASCKILYKPLVMTKQDPHTGSIFFKIPDGKAILYNFKGTTDPPEPIKTITLTIPCKRQHTEVLIVRNWSRNKQQFKVFTEDVTPGDLVNLYDIKGHAFVDVLGNTEREYNWNFYGFKECLLEFRVIFMNHAKEYMFYKLLITVTKCKTLETITLTTCIRSPVIYELKLINPLQEYVSYKLTSTSPVLGFKTPVYVDPHSEILSFIEYNPLIVETSEVILEATCSELGTYPYKFLLSAHEPVSEPELKFSTVLGESQTLNATVKNLTKSKASFTCKVEDEESFTVVKLLTLSANQTTYVPIIFNPYKIGTGKTKLTISSPTAGDFIFPLHGICLSPKPKGPLIVKPDSSVIIDFYNPFLIDVTFIINVTPNIFSVISTEEFIKSKMNSKITVKMTEKVDKSSNDISGKLLIIPKDKSLGDVNWIYYLHGHINE